MWSFQSSVSCPWELGSDLYTANSCWNCRRAIKSIPFCKVFVSKTFGTATVVSEDIVGPLATSFSNIEDLRSLTLGGVCANVCAKVLPSAKLSCNCSVFTLPCIICIILSIIVSNLSNLLSSWTTDIDCVDRLGSSTSMKFTSCSSSVRIYDSSKSYRFS